MPEYKYEKQESYDCNFRRWFDMNRKEREMFNDRLLSEEEAFARFSSLYPQPSQSRNPLRQAISLLS